MDAIRSSAVAPSSVEEFREKLAAAAAAGQAVEVGGAFSKRSMGGPAPSADVAFSTRNLDRLRAYEPADLTIGVEAGMPYKRLAETLAANNQFLPLDPPCGEEATVGGILAANCSGPRRRRYGAARDMTIGMEFATLEGKLVRSGGMVVKNVTGLDMGKLMIGSFGTLAAVVTANFKVFPRPERSASLIFASPEAGALLDVRRSILQSVLHPVALDWLNPSAAADIGLGAEHALLVEVSGSAAAVERSRAELAALRPAAVALEDIDDGIWTGVREFMPRALRRYPDGAAIRVTTTASRLERLLQIAEDLGCETLLRAGNAVGYLAADGLEAARTALERLRGEDFPAVVEAGAEAVRGALDLWRPLAPELAVMRRIKADFDPRNLLNRGRLYGVL